MRANLEKIKQKIILDEEYIEWGKEIKKVEETFANSSNFNNRVALDHGIMHMERVANQVYLLLQQYGCDERTCLLGYIAGLIHDIGMIYGKENHAQNGSELSKMFLKKLQILSDREIETVANAILTHGSGENTENCIGIFLALVDKVDICKERSIGVDSPIKRIERYTMNIKENTLEIDYEMTSLKGKEGIYMIPKTIDVPMMLVEKLGLNIQFFINGIIEDFADRIAYKGEIYKREEKGIKRSLH